MSSQRFTLRAAVYLVLIRDGKTLLSRRFNTGWMDGQYSLISGHIDGNETVFTAMLREAEEEAGVKIASKDLKPLRVIHRKSSDSEYMDFFFIAHDWQGEPEIKETDKCDALNWFAIDNLPENTLPYVKEIIQSINQNIPFSVSGWDKK